jgi:hypothetical protein
LEELHIQVLSNLAHDRLKTEEELAKEEKERLEKQEVN